MGKKLVVAAAVLWALACGKKADGPKTVEEALKAIQVDGDFEVQLFAAEPMVVDPVEVVFDERGRAYVADMLDLPWDPPKGKKARSRIVLLEDTNGDGRADKSTVFAENVLQVSGLMVWKGGLIVPSAPEILYFKDTDGDGKADVREVWFTGFFQGNPEAQITNPRMGLDNWIYFNNTGNAGRVTSPKHPEMKPLEVRGADFRYNPVKGLAETAAGAGQYGSTFDDWNNRFISQNTTHLRHVVMPMHYLARAPNLEVRDVNQDPYGKRERLMWPLTKPQEWRVKRSEMRQKRYDENKTGRVEHAAGHITGATGSTVYRGDAWPREYYGNIFTADVSGNLVRRDLVEPDGVSFAAKPAYEGREFLASTDQWFRPTNFANAPDGHLYMPDMYREIIETPLSIPEELKKGLDFYSGDDKGRIYRLVSKRSTVKRGLKVALDEAPTGDLVKMLEHANGWHVETARRLLLERQDKTAVEPLRRLGTARALWALEGLGALTEADVVTALKSTDGRLREQAVRMSESLPATASLERLLTPLAADAEIRVRFQTALTLGRHAQSAAARAALVKIAQKDAANDWVRTAVMLSGAGSPVELLRQTQKLHVDFEKRLARLIGVRQQAGEIAAILPLLGEEGLESLGRGLELSGARGLKVAGAERLGEKGWKLARYLAMPGLMASAEKLAQDATIDPARRALALQALRGGSYAKAAAALESVVKTAAPGNVQGAAIDTVASFGDAGVPGELLRHWKQYAPEGRTRAIAALLQQTARVPALLDAIEKGAVEAAVIEVGARNRLLEDANPAVAQRAKTLLKAGGDRAKVVESYRDVVKMRGNVAHGKEVFEDACAKCHLPRQQGGRVGPDLSGISMKSKEELLEAILNPSASIEPRFVNYIVTTKDGRTFDGVLANETPGAITLRGGQETDVTVLRGDVQSIRASSISLMPEDLEKGLSKQGMADLIAYLRGEE